MAYILSPLDDPTKQVVADQENLEHSLHELLAPRDTAGTRAAIDAILTKLNGCPSARKVASTKQEQGYLRISIGIEDVQDAMQEHERTDA